MNNVDKSEYTTNNKRHANKREATQLDCNFVHDMEYTFADEYYQGLRDEYYESMLRDFRENESDN